MSILNLAHNCTVCSTVSLELRYLIQTTNFKLYRFFFGKLVNYVVYLNELFERSSCIIFVQFLTSISRDKSIKARDRYWFIFSFSMKWKTRNKRHLPTSVNCSSVWRLYTKNNNVDSTDNEIFVLEKKFFESTIYTDGL